MGLEYFKRPILAPRGVVSPSSEYRTVASTATILPLNGTVTLATTAAGDKTYRLATPLLGGRVHVTAVDSTHVENVRTNTTAQTFFGTTFQTLTWTTAVAYRMATFEVVGPSTNPKWMVAAKSTGATLA